LVSNTQGVILYFFWVIAIIAFVVEVWALVDAVRTQGPAFEAAGKLAKRIWLIILGIANVVGLAGAANFLPVYSMLPVIAFIAAAIYLADVRPAVAPYRKRGGRGQHMGPYGPW
jgi:Protein of unknown function (DUF2516)